MGLEFVNSRWLKRDGGGGWVNHVGNTMTTSDLNSLGGFIEAPHPRVGSGTYAWPLFTAAQLATGLEIARALTAKYPIAAVVSHEEIDTRGWTTDPGPAFPQQAFVDLLDDRGGVMERLVVGAARLNLRGGPGTDYERLDPPGQLPGGTEVTVLRREGNWGYVEVIRPAAPASGVEPGLRGWVHHSYLELQLDG